MEGWLGRGKGRREWPRGKGDGLQKGMCRKGVREDTVVIQVREG